MKSLDGYLIRWALELQHHDSRIAHQARGINNKSYGLSCLPSTAYLEPEDDQLFDLVGHPKLRELEAPGMQEI